MKPIKCYECEKMDKENGMTKEEVERTNRKKMSVKKICEKSWNDTLSPDEVKKALSVKRYKIRSELGVSSLADFMDAILDTREAFFSVVYLWNGRGYSALRPFCDCERVEWIHPLHGE